MPFLVTYTHFEGPYLHVVRARPHSPAAAARMSSRACCVSARAVPADSRFASCSRSRAWAFAAAFAAILRSCSCRASACSSCSLSAGSSGWVVGNARLLHRASCVLYIERVFLDASLRASSKQTFSFSIHFLFYKHLFHVSSSFYFFCLARCGFRLLPSFCWDALWGIFSDVTLPYMERVRCAGPGCWHAQTFFVGNVLSFGADQTCLQAESTMWKGILHCGREKPEPFLLKVKRIRYQSA
jgi:hypothetical protein